MLFGRPGLLVVVLVSIFILLGGAEARKPLMKAIWRSWKVINGKKYSTLREERLRTRIFEQNYNFCKWHNTRFNLGLETYTTALNKFADLTLKEFADQYLTLKPRGEGKTFLKRSRVRYLDHQTPVPNSVDWRKKGFVTPVKDQGQCGSCWAFSATGSLEGQIKNVTDKLLSISEQQLVDCSNRQGNQGCNGGLMDFAFKYWKLNGPELETSYPYKARDGRCRFNKTLVVANVTGFHDVAKFSEQQLTLSVANVGPVSVAIDASGSGFQMYSSGVYTDLTCDPNNLDHGVLAVGYDVDPSGREYWIVKNSWGTSWGQQGYIWMARNKENMCGIATAASYPILKGKRM